MSRPRRIWQHNCPYSITTRINNREFHLKNRKVDKIFRYIFTLLSTRQNIDTVTGKKSARYVFKVHHFLIMNNHYHLIISTPNPAVRIDRIMQLINSMAARAVNKQLGRNGHLWGDRYKMRVLDSYEYLMRSIVYLYQNPIRAKLVSSPFKYGRSTLAFYINRNSDWPLWYEPDEWSRSLGSSMRAVFLETLGRSLCWQNKSGH